MKQIRSTSFKLEYLFSILITGLVALGSTACSKTKDIKSLSQMLKEEEIAISKLINKENIMVRNYAEGQTSFDKGIYYKFSNGLYMEVLEAGGERPVAEKTRVNVRFEGYIFNKDSIQQNFNNLSMPGFQDTEFIYVDRYSRGALHFILIKSAPGYSLNALMCEGLAFPMSLLGDGAKVRLIIPFTIGAEINYNRGSTMYCREVRYEFTRQ